jgi:predicted Zn finger-like uncharacterized protein
MKISCPACKSKYTIADEKVQGRSVKVRCRKCGEAIFVNASEGAEAPAAAPEPPPAPSDSSAPMFSVLIAEGDQRDMSLADVVSAYNSGLVTADTFVWADGQTDWMPLGEVAAIVDALNAASAAVDEAARSPAHPAEPEPEPALPPPPVEPIASAAAPFDSPPIPSAAAAEPFGIDHAAVREDRRRKGVDLFAARSEEEVATSAPQLSSVVAAPSAPPAQPTGARGDSSVLFSLSALTASTGAAAADGAAAKDDSGLIDLKALAAKSDGVPKVQDMLAAGGVPILDAAPLLGTPLMEAPAGDDDEKPVKSKTPMFIGVGIMVAGLAIAGAYVFTAKAKTPPVVETPSATATTEPTVAAVPTDTDTSGAAPPSTGAPTTSATGKQPGKGYVGKGGAVKGGKAGPGAAAPETPGATPAKPPPPRSKCGCAPTDLACNMACAAK